MILDRVTITGADDSIRPEELLPLTEQFLFVEWGILASEKMMGSPRFPSMEWIDRLQTLAIKHDMLLSLHLCGRWVRQLLMGLLVAPQTLIRCPEFQRVQLNFHAENTPCDPGKLHSILWSLGDTQFIFQIDGAGGNKHLEALYAENGDEFVDAVPLFDLSGGAGIVPKVWPEPQYMANDIDFIYHGYAGGLGPHNLEAELPRIADASGPARIWIDMETHVRSDHDRLFDLDKARRALEICEPMIGREWPMKPCPRKCEVCKDSDHHWMDDCDMM